MILPQKTRKRVASVKEKDTNPMMVLARESGERVDCVDRVTPILNEDKPLKEVKTRLWWTKEDM